MNKTVWIVLLVCIAGAVVYTTSCPCSRVPGAWLFGEWVTDPVDDWSFVNDADAVPLCQVEIQTWRPHSINLNCMADAGKLFVSCSNCAGKRWSQDALKHPAGKIRAAGRVYPVRFERITDPTTPWIYAGANLPWEC